MINVSAINLAVPQESALRGKHFRREAFEVLFNPGITGRKVVYPRLDTREFILAVAKGDNRLGIGFVDYRIDLPPIVKWIIIRVEPHAVEPPPRNLVSIYAAGDPLGVLVSGLSARSILPSGRGAFAGFVVPRWPTLGQRENQLVLQGPSASA